MTKMTSHDCFPSILFLVFCVLVLGMTAVPAHAQEPLASRRLQARVSATGSGEAFSSIPGKLRRVISIQLEGLLLEAALHRIAQAGDVKLFYPKLAVLSEQKVHLDLERVTVLKAVHAAIRGTKLHVQLSRSGHLVLFHVPEAKARPAIPEPLGSVRKLVPATLERLRTPPLQTGTITGMVTDSTTGEPLPGVNVVVAGLDLGSATNADGRYRITDVPVGEQTVIATFVGYAPKRLPIDVEEGNNELNIALAPQVLGLKNVVVTALGVEREQRAIGYSVQEVEGEELAMVPEANFISSLQGQIAGAAITSSNVMGGSTRIVLRGPNSVLGNNQPLIVVDGVPITNANITSGGQATGSGGYDYGNAASVLNPANIKSVTVLKGPTAAALYGSRAANGVIQITTKSGAGTEGIGVTVNTSLMASRVYGLPDFQNRYGGGPWAPLSTLDGDLILDERVDAPGDGTHELVPDQRVVSIYGAVESWGQRLDGRPVRQWYSWDEVNGLMGQATPWVAHPNNIENFFRSGLTWNTTVSFSQGAEGYNYRLSLSSIQNNGVFPNAHLGRKQISFHGNVDLTDRLRVRAMATYTDESAVARPVTGYGFTRSVMFQLYHFWHRQLDLGPDSYMRAYRRPNGEQRTWTWRGIDGAIEGRAYWDNPYWIRFKNYETDDTERLFGKIRLAYNFTDALVLSATLGTDYYNEQRQERIASGSMMVEAYEEGHYERQETKVEGRLTYDGQLSEDVSLSAVAGANYRYRTYGVLSGSTIGGLSAPNVFTLENSENRPSISDYFEEQGVFSLFGTTTIGWRNLLYLGLTARSDWTSTLPAENNSYFYPSASLSFVFSSLPALQESDVLSFGKLRLAYARVGSDTAPYRLENIFPLGIPFIGRTLQSRSDQLNNAELKPELTRSWEIGTQLQFFNNRVGMDATYYQEATSNQIIAAAIASATGYTSTILNAGKITNQGLELALNVTPVLMQNLQWDVSLNWAKNVNEVVELVPGLEAVTLGSITWGPAVQARVGYPYGVLYDTDFVYDANGNKVLNPDGTYAESEPRVLGTYLPDWSWGASSTLSYKGFTASVRLNGQMGGSMFSLNNHWGLSNGLVQETVRDGVRQLGVDPGGVWFPDGMPEDPSQAVGTSYNKRVDPHLYFDTFAYGPRAALVYDATYVKLRELVLGYTLPQAWLAGTPIRSFTVSLIGSNLATLYKETPNVHPGNAISAGNVQGFEAGQIPPQRSYGISLRLSL